MSKSDLKTEFAFTGYGKNFVKLLQLRQEGKVHYVKEMEVSTQLTLNNTKDYLQGDNSDIIATDSQKNTVYVLAKQHGVSRHRKKTVFFNSLFFILRYNRNIVENDVNQAINNDNFYFTIETYKKYISVYFSELMGSVLKFRQGGILDHFYHNFISTYMSIVSRYNFNKL